jgi:DNA-binding Lrp family transcriptional regulator
VEISQKTGIKVTTCRKCLSRLEKKGKIRKHSYGFYTSLSYDVAVGSSMVGAAGSPLALNPEPRLHCLRLRVFDVAGNPRRWRLDFGLVRVSFKRYAHGTAQVFVHCRRGCSLDYIAFRFLVEIVLRQVHQHDWKKVIATSFEFNHDYAALRLDGVKAITLTTFDGSFRRVYSKRHGLRDEVKTVGSVQADRVLSLLKGGDTYNATRFLSDAVAELRQTNNIMSDAAHQMRRVADAVVKQGTGRGQES